MVEDFDAQWWSRYRERLEKTFDQKEIMVRAIEARKL